LDTTAHPPLQHNQLMAERSILCLKSALRLEGRDEQGQEETEPVARSTMCFARGRLRTERPPLCARIPKVTTPALFKLALSFPKIRSGRIRAVRENQTIIQCDVCDHLPAWNIYRRSV
jgi:hypothetical protein